MVKLKSVRPEMGCYYYTREGRAAYVTYALEDGKPLPLAKGVQPYPLSIGFIYGYEDIMAWTSAGVMDHPFVAGKHDLVERITMEQAFRHPRRPRRVKVVSPQQMGMLL